MKIFTKKRICFGAVIAAVLGLAQCDGVKTFLSNAFSPSPIIDFPFGEKAMVSYKINSWIDKPYVMKLKVEYLNVEKSLDPIRFTIPYNFSVQCYHLDKEQETLIFKNTYSMQNDSNLFYGGNGWSTNAPNSVGKSLHLKNSLVRLPYGNYRCDFEDKSSPEIKEKLNKAGIIRTAVDILPYEEPLFY